MAKNHFPHCKKHMQEAPKNVRKKNTRIQSLRILIKQECCVSTYKYSHQVWNLSPTDICADYRVQKSLVATLGDLV